MTGPTDETPEEKLARVATIHVLRPRAEQEESETADALTISDENEDDAEIKRLAGLSRLDFDRQRKEAAARLGVRAPILDKLVAAARQSAGDDNGRSLRLSDPDPWPEPIDGAQLLDGIAAYIRDHLVLRAHQAEAMALWALHAHAHDAAHISPRLAFTSPEKRCGKTTALMLMQNVVPRPLSASNITAAALFRTVESAKPTLLIDEADTFIRNSDELRGVLNSGHNEATAFVVRTVGDQHEPAKFRTWAAVVIAMIGQLPDTLADRSIKIEMQRKRPCDTVRRFRPDRTEYGAKLCRQAARWAADSHRRLRAWDGVVPDGLHDRAADNWRPLLAIADVAGGNWPELTRTAALVLSTGEADGSAGAMILQDIEAILSDVHEDRIASADLLGRLKDMEGRPWPEWRHGNPITATQLARLLKPFGITPTTVRTRSGSVSKGYLRSDFADAFARYGQSSRYTVTS